MPYTIVLTPPADQAAKYIEAAQALYSEHQSGYLLNRDGTSSPHITVVQFNCDCDLVHKIWTIIREKMVTETLLPFSPPFTGIAFVEGAGLYKGTTWVELSVERGDINSPIMRVHHTALEVLEQFDLKPLNASGNNYRPHLTLARIVLPEQMKTWPKNLCEDPGDFKLELGSSDEQWQYAQSMATFL